MEYDITILERFFNSLIIFVPKLIVAIVIFFVSLYLGGWIARVVHRILNQRQKDPELTALLCRVTRWAIIIFGTVWALDQVEFDITGFVAGLGIVGFTIGFALKDVAQNFVAGILLLLQQPFDIGDAVEVNGYAGVVTNIEIRATTLRSWDGLLLIVPNFEVYTNAITNYTKVDKRRIDLQIGVAYDTDLSRAQQVMLDAISPLPGVITGDPAPSVVFEAFGESAIEATLYFWFDTKTVGYFTMLDSSVKALKIAFERENITIPYPIRTIQMPPPSVQAAEKGAPQVAADIRAR